MITLNIQPPILRDFAEVRCSALVVQGLHGSGILPPSPDEVRSSLTDIGVSIDTLVDQAPIADWRKVFRRAGLKPSTFRSSPEALARRYLKGGAIESAVPAVNAYCAISAMCLAPLGAYDIGRLPGDHISLRYASRVDEFDPIGGTSGLNMPMSESVVVYAMDSQVLCWSWNHRDSRQTCLVPDTVQAIFIGEAASSSQYAPLDRSIKALSTLLRSTGAVVSPVVTVDASSPSAALDS